LVVLDAGCGTGLAAPTLRPLAATLHGLDLSPAMVAKARQRRLYDALYEADLENYLNRHPESYDLIVAADVMVYLGDLSAPLAAARNALHDGGTLAFTLERTEESESYMLGAKHRYAHSRKYVAQQAEHCGFKIELLEDAVTRKDGGEDVPGLLVVLRKKARKND